MDINDYIVRKPIWLREFFAEFFGTFFIIVLGDGAIANYVLNKDNKNGPDHFAICFAFGVGVLIGISISATISGAHLNPAVTVALASIKKFPVHKIPHYLLAQYLGSFMAAFAIFCAYYEAIEAYDSGMRTAYMMLPNTTGATGGIFSTYPAIHVTLMGSVVDQTLATFMLMFAVMAIIDKKNLNVPEYLVPTVLALVITAICIAFGLNCGAVLNPARDLGPRIFQSLAGYGLKPFNPIRSLYWLTAGVIGPHLGAIVGAWSYQLAISSDNNDSDKEIHLNDIELKKSDNRTDRTQESSKSQPLLSSINVEKHSENV